MAAGTRWRPASPRPPTGSTRCARSWPSVSATASTASARPAAVDRRGAVGGGRYLRADRAYRSRWRRSASANPEPRFAFPAIRLAHVEPVGSRSSARYAGRQRPGPGMVPPPVSAQSRSASPTRRSAAFSPPPAGARSISPAISGATPTAAATRSSSLSTTPPRWVEDQPRPKRRSSSGNSATLVHCSHAVDGALDLAGAVLGQHGAGQFAELGADLRLGKRLVEVAAMAVAGLRRLPSVGQRDRDPGRSQIAAQARSSPGLR